MSNGLRFPLLACVAALSASASAEAPQKRPMPVYDGRADEETSASDVARTAGRVVLFPAWLITNYGVRWPVGKFARWLESSPTMKRLLEGAASPSSSRTPSATPSLGAFAFYDKDFRSALGVRLGFATPASEVRFDLGVGTGGVALGDWMARVALPGDLHVWGEASLSHRKDRVYYGTGPRSDEGTQARWAELRGAVGAAVGWRPFNVFVRSVTHVATESSFDGDPSILQQVAAGRIDRVPAGYNEPVITRRGGARIALDSRARGQSGAYFDAVIERVNTNVHSVWTHVNMELGGTLQLDRVDERRLDIRMGIELINGETDKVPFMELASIGGTHDLRGFGDGRGRDASRASIVLDYRWPLGAWLDATLYMGAGNVFGEDLSGFYVGKLRGSAGLGLRIAGLLPERRIEIWSAFGVEPFDQGIDASSFRLLVGYTYDD